MSGLVKGVKKVFKKVAKVVKKVAPIALAIGAAVFTGGAALGLTSMAGGWSAAAGSVASALGAGGGGVLSSAITGAITQAGYGALMSGTIAELSGGSFSDGAKVGATVGAVTGGISGALGAGGNAATEAGNAIDGPAGQVSDKINNVTANAADPSAFAEAAVPGGTPNSRVMLQGVSGGGTPNSRVMLQGVNDVAGGGGSGGAGAGAGAGGGAGGGGRGLMNNVFREGGWLERNQDMVGKTVSGLGQGLMASAGSDAEMDMMRERSNRVRRNYQGADPNRNFAMVAPGRSTATPTDQYGAGATGAFEYQFDPKQGRIVRVPIES